VEEEAVVEGGDEGRVGGEIGEDEAVEAEGEVGWR